MVSLTQSYFCTAGLFILLGPETGSSHSCIPVVMSNQPLKMSIYRLVPACFSLCLHSLNLSYHLIRVCSTHSYFRVIDISVCMVIVVQKNLYKPLVSVINTTQLRQYHKDITKIALQLYIMYSHAYHLLFCRCQLAFVLQCSCIVLHPSSPTSIHSLMLEK